MSIDEFILENDKRKSELFSFYDPITGEGSHLERIEFYISDSQENPIYIPTSMMELDFINDSVTEGISLEQYSRDWYQDYNQMLTLFNYARLKYDFEFWAVVTVKFKPKGETNLVPFVCRTAQRKLLRILEELRVNKRPIWIILCKSRQWGGSTLIDFYMGWVQIMHKERWNSLIVGEVESQAVNVRKMYQELVDNYPKEIDDLSIKPFEGSSKNKEIPERNCVINLGSMQKPDGIRSADINMAHLTEVGLWKKTEGKKPEDLVQSILGTLPRIPYSFYALESTAKGIGNFFHEEWLAAKKGDSNLTPVFVAWWEIEMYIKEFESEVEKINLIKSLSEYEMFLWNLGATLEGINWYREKLRDYKGNQFSMRSEFPSNDIEAFQSSGRRAFSEANVQWMRDTCKDPAFIGDTYPNTLRGKEALENITFEEYPEGNLKIWKKPNDPPCPENHIMRDRYCAFVDIGGKTKKADYSVISIFDRFWMAEGDVPVRVATWRGHLDQDLFAWKAAQVCKWYNNALLAFEVNSLRTQDSDTEGDHALTMLDEIAEHYDNLYTRTRPELIAEGAPKLWGFHTNRSSKTMIVNNFNALLRDRGYIEYDMQAAHEADIYEVRDDGSFGNIEGANNKDDVLITTMGGTWLATKYMDPPSMVKLRQPKPQKRARSNKGKSANLSAAKF